MKARGTHTEEHGALWVASEPDYNLSRRNLLRQVLKMALGGTDTGLLTQVRLPLPASEAGPHCVRDGLSNAPCSGDDVEEALGCWKSQVLDLKKEATCLLAPVGFRKTMCLKRAEAELERLVQANAKQMAVSRLHVALVMSVLKLLRRYLGLSGLWR